MAEKHEQSGRAADRSSQLIPFGQWPNINLILTDETGSVDYGYTSKALGDAPDDSVTAGDTIGGKKTWTLDIHTQLTIDETTFKEVRKGLEKRNTPGRRDAYNALKKSAEFKRAKPGSAERKMVKEALEGL